MLDKLFGLELEREAVPSFIVKLKSDTSKDPLPPLVLYTASLRVTETVVLSEEIAIAVMIGGSLSFKETVLLL